MSLNAIRPKITDLCLYVYGSPLHPEFFNMLACERVTVGARDLRVAIVRSGHYWSLGMPGHHLTEVACRRTDPLPNRRRLLSHRLRGEREETLTYPTGLSYHTSFTVERLEAEVFVQVHDELLEAGRRDGLFYSFQAHQRLALPPLTHVTSEFTADFASIQTFHTFPHDLSVIRTQSLIEWP